jgi:hypothetical protein
MDMSTVTLLEPEDMKGNRFLKQATNYKDINSFQLVSQTTDKISNFSAPTLNEKTMWIQSLTDSITESFTHRQSLKMKNRRTSMAIPQSSKNPANLRI